MKKTLLIGLFAAAAMTATAADDYCTHSGTVSGTGRSITKVTVTDGNNTLDIPGAGAAANRPVYVDHSADKIFTTEPGAEIEVSRTGTGEWMHSYLYIDLNNDKEFTVNFDTDAWQALEGNELIFFDRLSPKAFSDSGAEDPWKSYDGSSQNGGRGVLYEALPVAWKMTVPANMPAGDYRVRFKVDWNDVNPCGSSRSGNAINANQGTIIDFTLRIEISEPRTVTVASANETLGSVEIVGQEGNSVNTTEPVTVKATPANDDTYFVNWTNSEGEEVSTEAEFTYRGGETTLTANFEVRYTISWTDAEPATLRLTKADGSSLQNGDMAVEGEELTFTLEMPRTFMPASIAVNYAPVLEQYLENNSYTFTLNQATTILYTVRAVPCTVEYVVDGNGTLELYDENGYDIDNDTFVADATPLANNTDMDADSELYIKILPMEGEDLEALVINGVPAEDEDIFETADGVKYGWAWVDGPTSISAKFTTRTSSIESIAAENAPAEIFNLQGVRVAADTLTPGFYIVRRGTKAETVIVK